MRFKILTKKIDFFEDYRTELTNASKKTKCGKRMVEIAKSYSSEGFMG